MKTRGDKAPSAAFTLEPVPNKPSYSMVRFYENARKIEERDEETTTTAWEYDEYTLVLPRTPGLAASIEANYNAYMKRAKLEEEAKTAPTESQQLRADVDYLAAMAGVTL